MELVFDQMLALLYALWWPFCRILAFLSAAPIVGDGMVPLPVRVLLSVALAVVLLPASQAGMAIDPFSLHGVMATVEQAVIGGVLGLAFHLTMSVILLLGYMVSSQMGLSMAVMNDPVNGTSSDVVSGLLVMLCTLVFFAVDGHLVLVGVVGQSFRAWPVGSGLQSLMLQTLSLNVAWVFSAAALLAMPMIFSTLVVQVGFGFLNRVAPTLNLFSLGFSVITLFGLFMLVQLMRFVPEHYVRMSGRVLEMLQTQMRGLPHG
jgi:flagellar biosynthetic protein FliR